jgi:hypothetical protein
MFKLLGDSNKGLPSVINNPFSMENITGVSMHATPKLWEEGKFDFWGYVEFKKGDTIGKQRFDAKSLGELYKDIYNFCEELGVRRG